MLCTSLGVQAHQPDLSSTMLVSQGENKWVLQVRAALTAFEYEIENHYGKGSYTSPEEFQGLAIKHLQGNISILFNDINAVKLKNGLVKLGHETSVTFEVDGAPESLQSLVVKNSSFSNLSRNQSALIVLKEGFSNDQFTLNNNNDHTVELQVKDAKFELVIPAQSNTKGIVLIFATILLVITLLYFAYRKLRTNVFDPIHMNV